VERVQRVSSPTEMKEIKEGDQPVSSVSECKGRVPGVSSKTKFKGELKE